MTNLLIFPKANKNQHDRQKFCVVLRDLLYILHNKNAIYFNSYIIHNIVQIVYIL